MYGSGGGGQNQTDQIASFFWVLVMAFGAVLLVWWLRPQWIIVPIFKVRIVELDLFIGVESVWFHVLNWFHLSSATVSGGAVEHMRLVLSSVDPHQLKFEEFSKINQEIGHWSRYPVIVILLVLASIVGLRHTSVKFRNDYSMKSLRKAERDNWPQIAPVIDIDLVKQDIEEGPWAMAQTPIRFCKQRDLLVVQQKNDQMVHGLKSDLAYQEISLQVGRHWKNVQSLPIHVKALVVIFIARAKRDRELSNHLLSQIAASAASGKLDFTGVEEALAVYKKERIISWVTQRHAYVNTVLATLLEIGRADGVLASSEFLWLKPVDRSLWYILNSVGRQTAVIEAAGSFAHWLAEKRIGRAIKTPMVKEAIRALEKEVENILYIDESEQWHSNAA